MVDKPLVLMTHDLPADWIGNSLDEYQIILGDNTQRGIDNKLKRYLPEASGIICLLDDPISSEIINQAPLLKVVSNMAVGTDNINVKSCTSLGIPVGHTPGVLTDGTADLTIALLLSVSRRLAAANQDARDGKWLSWEPTGWLGRDLKDATVGIIGLGKIGSAVAERLKPFGCKLIFNNRSPLPDQETNLNARQVDLDELLTTSNFICLHVPLTQETIGLIGKEEFEKMKPTTIMINTARGPVVTT
ncbi:MAG: D-glycerate dehydrogenase, partial [Chloroflexota bacterium]